MEFEKALRVAAKVKPEHLWIFTDVIRDVFDSGKVIGGESFFRLGEKSPGRGRSITMKNDCKAFTQDDIDQLVGLFGWEIWVTPVGDGWCWNAWAKKEREMANHEGEVLGDVGNELSTKLEAMRTAFTQIIMTLYPEDYEAIK